MRIIKCCCLLMAVIVFLTGCANSIPDKPKEETEISTGDILDDKSKEETYSIEVIAYNVENVKVEYPKIQGLKDKESEEKLNKIIRDYILLDIIEPDEIAKKYGLKMNMNLECHITLQSQELLSFYYEGAAFVDGDSSFPCFYSMTLDMIAAKELKLYDFIDIDETLVERINKSTDVTNQAVESGMDKKSLLGVIQQREDEWKLECLASDWQEFVLEPDAIVIEMLVTNFAGVYALVRLPGRIVDNRFIFDEYECR